MSQRQGNPEQARQTTTTRKHETKRQRYEHSERGRQTRQTYRQRFQQRLRQDQQLRVEYNAKRRAQYAKRAAALQSREQVATDAPAAAKTGSKLGIAQPRVEKKEKKWAAKDLGGKRAQSRKRCQLEGSPDAQSTVAVPAWKRARMSAARPREETHATADAKDDDHEDLPKLVVVHESVASDPLDGATPPPRVRTCERQEIRTSPEVAPLSARVGTELGRQRHAATKSLQQQQHERNEESDLEPDADELLDTDRDVHMNLGIDAERFTDAFFSAMVHVNYCPY